MRKECLLATINDTSKVIAGGLNSGERAALLREHGGDKFSAVLASSRPEDPRGT